MTEFRHAADFMISLKCDCEEDEMCIVCHYEKKQCCHHLPIGVHCQSCDDDERGDQESHARRENYVV